MPAMAAELGSRSRMFPGDKSHSSRLAPRKGPGRWPGGIRPEDRASPHPGPGGVTGSASVAAPPTRRQGQAQPGQEVGARLPPCRSDASSPAPRSCQRGRRRTRQGGRRRVPGATTMRLRTSFPRAARPANAGGRHHQGGRRLSSAPPGAVGGGVFHPGAGGMATNPIAGNPGHRGSLGAIIKSPSTTPCNPRERSPPQAGLAVRG